MKTKADVFVHKKSKRNVSSNSVDIIRAFNKCLDLYEKFGDLTVFIRQGDKFFGENAFFEATYFYQIACEKDKILMCRDKLILQNDLVRACECCITAFCSDFFKLKHRSKDKL